MPRGRNGCAMEHRGPIHSSPGSANSTHYMRKCMLRWLSRPRTPDKLACATRTPAGGDNRTHAPRFEHVVLFDVGLQVVFSCCCLRSGARNFSLFQLALCCFGFGEKGLSPRVEINTCIGVERARYGKDLYDRLLSARRCGRLLYS